jgi:pyruvate kinase
MPLPKNKTKIVCTVGPSSDSLPVLERMIRGGMDVARLNFSHADFTTHAEMILRIRRASQAAGKRVAIMADLPGPKIRLGVFGREPIELGPGDVFTLTTDEVEGTQERAFVNFPRLPQVVRAGDSLFLNDGMIQMTVLEVSGVEVRCEVVAGGPLSSRKGLNIPEVDLGISAFTDHDRACLEFALGEGVDAVSQSFVESAADVTAVREASASLGHQPFIIAKIERARALIRIDEILDAADGIMVARGDLGVEIPIERIALTQKQLIRKANRLGKPVITATQMLESMIASNRPTRAEATDVANAILDGTDAVMLSGESAVGRYPVEAVNMLAAIAAATEPARDPVSPTEQDGPETEARGIRPSDILALSVATAFRKITPAAIIVPTRGGATAQRISRFRLPVWITAVSSSETTCQNLLFYYGVAPVLEPDHPTDWREWIRRWMASEGIRGRLVLLTEGPSRKHPGRNHRMEIIDLEGLG